jgi:hypothetical protein
LNEKKKKEKKGGRQGRKEGRKKDKRADLKSKYTGGPFWSQKIVFYHWF